MYQSNTNTVEKPSKINIRKIHVFLFPKTFEENKMSLRFAFFYLMAIWFIASVAMFFFLTGFRLKNFLTQPFFVSIFIVLTLLNFKFVRELRRMAILVYDSQNYLDLKLIYRHFLKRYLVDIGITFHLLAIAIYFQGESLQGIGMISLFWIVFIFFVIAELKIVFYQPKSIE